MVGVRLHTCSGPQGMLLAAPLFPICCQCEHSIQWLMCITYQYLHWYDADYARVYFTRAHNRNGSCFRRDTNALELFSLGHDTVIVIVRSTPLRGCCTLT